MKSEPNTYSISDLRKEEKTIWDGVRNYQARNFLRQMQVGDLSFFYHSNVAVPGIVGLMQIIENNVIEPSQFDSQSPYYDSKSKLNAPRWQTVVVEFVNIFPELISLKTLKELFTPEDLLLLRRGNRLSVMPVEETIAQKILTITHQ